MTAWTVFLRDATGLSVYDHWPLVASWPKGEEPSPHDIACLYPGRDMRVSYGIKRQGEEVPRPENREWWHD